MDRDLPPSCPRCSGVMSARTVPRVGSPDIRIVFLCHCGHVETRDQPDRRQEPRGQPRTKKRPAKVR
jgi:hypothetical protein